MTVSSEWGSWEPPRSEMKSGVSSSGMTCTRVFLLLLCRDLWVSWCIYNENHISGKQFHWLTASCNTCGCQNILLPWNILYVMNKVSLKTQLHSASGHGCDAFSFLPEATWLVSSPTFKSPSLHLNLCSIAFTVLISLHPFISYVLWIITMKLCFHPGLCLSCFCKLFKMTSESLPK
jgi:hypothetical protein